MKKISAKHYSLSHCHVKNLKLFMISKPLFFFVLSLPPQIQHIIDNHIILLLHGLFSLQTTFPVDFTYCKKYHQLCGNIFTRWVFPFWLPLSRRSGCKLLARSHAGFRPLCSSFDHFNILVNGT